MHYTLCVYVCVHARVCLCLCVYVRLCAYIHICVHTCACLCPYCVSIIIPHPNQTVMGIYPFLKGSDIMTSWYFILSYTNDLINYEPLVNLWEYILGLDHVVIVYVLMLNVLL